MEDKTKQQLVEEIALLRREVAQLEQEKTECKKAEEALRESEEKYRVLTQAAFDGIITIGENGRVLFWNRGAENIFGYTAEEALGKKLAQLVVPQPYREPVSRGLQRFFEAGTDPLINRHWEFPGLRKDGAEFPAELSVASVRVQDEWQAVAIVRDITERKQAEEALKNYKFIVESAHGAIFFKDLDSRYITANTKTLESFGLSLEEVIGKNDYELMTNQEEARKNIEDDQLVFKTGKPTEITKHMTAADGKDYWFHTVKVPQFDDKGNIIGLVGIARDITERKRAEKELETQRAHFSSIFDHSLEGIVTLDINNNILEANQGFQNIFGYRLEELKGVQLDDLIVPERFYHTETKELDKKALDGFLGHETVRKRKDGTEINVAMSAGPIKVGGKTTGRFVTFRDISNRKEAERLYKTMASSSQLGIYIIQDGKFVFINNSQFLKDSGFSPDEMLGMDSLAFVYPEDREMVRGDGKGKCHKDAERGPFLSL